METIAATLLGPWSFDLGLVVGLVLTTIVYLRGFREIRAQLPRRFPTWRRAAFVSGIGVLWLALQSPVDALADSLLQFHMFQHWLLMMVAPPLVWLGAPAVPMMRGLPRRWLVDGLGPLLAWSAIRRGLEFVVRPVFSWSVWGFTLVAWHWPFAYQVALRSRGWHDFEHASFLLAALLFWFPIVGPWPSRPARAGVRILYLAGAMVFNSVFAAIFTFSSRLFYPAYAESPTTWQITPLADQNAAGAFLWIAGSLSMGVAVVAVILTWLEPAAPRPQRFAKGAPARRGRTSLGSGALDLLKLPFIGAHLRSLRVRRAAQITLFVLAAAIVADGFLGPRYDSARNLAGVLPWTYWRGLVVIALLVLGNVFCAICPFTLTRSLAGRLFPDRFEWPNALKNSWVGVAGFLVFLWAYEVFSLWDSPLWTAWIIVGYFATFFLIECLFPHGTFCRSLCPIGQFQFVGSAVSPFEVTATDPTVCARCRSHDCLRGNETAPGCPTDLFMPTKSGSMNCTFCLDCVRACPNGNIGLLRTTSIGPPRSRIRPVRSLGRLEPSEMAVVAMGLLFSYGAFVNAAAMVAPVIAAERSLTAWLDASSRLPALTLGFAISLIALPVLATWISARLGRGLAGLELPHGRLIAGLAPSLVPIGFAMWLVHFGFHLATGLETAGPAVARVARDLGVMAGGAKTASLASSWLSAEALLGVEIAVLGIGLLASIVVAWRVALSIVDSPRSALGLAGPWMAVAALLYVAGLWIVQQPMEMRGMSM